MRFSSRPLSRPATPAFYHQSRILSTAFRQKSPKSGLLRRALFAHYHPPQKQVEKQNEMRYNKL
jgi:hypothetical protein